MTSNFSWAGALCHLFIVVLGVSEQAPEGFEPPVTSDDLVPRADLTDGGGLQESMVADARHQLGERALTLGTEAGAGSDPVG